jgi:mono/diheme cytochrome c family protein
MTRAWLVLLLVLPAVAAAQTPPADVSKRGAQVFAETCTGYCHGPAGILGGGAPRLAARGFDEAYLTATISNGLPGTAMPPFAGKLPRTDLTAVVAYVAGLNGRSAGVSASDFERPLPADAERGAHLFSDAVRSFGRCSTCHEVRGIGIPVTGPVLEVPRDVPSLRQLATPGVVTATAAGEAMPALLVSNASRSAIYYDLTAVPPVLRTSAPASVTFTPGSSWQHSSAIGSYTDDELASILTYLRAVVQP